MKSGVGYCMVHLFILILILGGVEGLTSCPDGYIKHELSCYRFHHQHLSWPESITYCKTLGSELVKIEDAQEHNFLIAKAQEIYGSFSVHNFWIDLTDALVQGEWSWTRDAYTKATYLHWGPDQPEYNKEREDCAGLVSYEGFLFGDWPCETLLNPICEVTLVPSGNEIIG